MEYGSRAQLSFNWAAKPGSNFGPNDKFVLDLGEYFANIEFGAHKNLPMVISHQNTDHTIGLCVFEYRKVTCTFNDEVAKLKAGGFDNFRGSLGLKVDVTKRTTEASVPVTVNGQQYQVTLPTDKKGGVGIVGPSSTPLSLHKGIRLHEGQKTNNYAIYFSGLRLKDYLGATGFELNREDEIHLRDSLINLQGEVDPAHTFATKPHPTDENKLVPADLSKWYLTGREITSQQEPKTFVLENAQPGVATGIKEVDRERVTALGWNGFEMTVEFNKATPHIADITLRGTFDENANYTISYPTDVTDAAGVKAGTVFFNKVDLLASTRSFHLEKSYIASAVVTAEAVPGYGYFLIEKRITGTAENQVTADHTVKVNYRYELPLPKNEYDGWVPPGTMTDDKNGTASCVINFRKTNLCLAEGAEKAKLLPQGTKVFITPADEDLSTVPEVLQGLKWGEPVVSLPQNTHATIVDDVAKTPRIIITNKADVNPMATFAVEKTVTGLKEGVSAPKYNFHYSCRLPDQQDVVGTIENVVAGAPATAVGKQFPVGTACVVSENTDGAEIAGYTLTAPEVQPLQLQQADETVTVRFTNHYTEIVEPEQPKPEQPKPEQPKPEQPKPEQPVKPENPQPEKPKAAPQLAKTGSTETAALAIVAAALIGAGATALRKRRG